MDSVFDGEHLPSPDDWQQVLLPEIEREHKQSEQVVFRTEAAFAKSELYEALEKQGMKYAIRIPFNREPGAGHCGTADPAGG